MEGSFVRAHGGGGRKRGKVAKSPPLPRCVRRKESRCQRINCGRLRKEQEGLSLSSPFLVSEGAGASLPQTGISFEIAYKGKKL